MVTPETEMLIKASVISDVLREGEAIYWLRRAQQFEDAKPRQGDFHGLATREELSAAWQRCNGLAEACRARAAVARMSSTPQSTIGAAA